jgi:hypothetical protein
MAADAGIPRRASRVQSVGYQVRGLIANPRLWSHVEQTTVTTPASIMPIRDDSHHKTIDRNGRLLMNEATREGEPLAPWRENS